MDINDLRSLATVTCFIALMGVFWWAYSPKRKKQFDEAANVLFDDSLDRSQTKVNDHSDGEHNR